MTPEQLQDYAEDLILDHATDVAYLSIHECAEDYTGGPISAEDARKVLDLITREAEVTVSWP